MKAAYAVSLIVLIMMPAQAVRPIHHHKAGMAIRSRSFELRGRWQVGPIVDPAHHPLPSDWAAQLTSARLPAPGEIIRAGPGSFCAGSIPCDEVPWTEDVLANEPGGTRLIQDFGFSSGMRVYTGDTGNRLISYTVVARSDKMLVAVVGLCKGYNRSADCYNALEVWHPISPDAKMVAVSARR